MKDVHAGTSLHDEWIHFSSGGSLAVWEIGGDCWSILGLRGREGEGGRE